MDSDLKHWEKFHDSNMANKQKEINTWLQLKAEMGGIKNYDFINGYFGEKRIPKIPIEVLEAQMEDKKGIKASKGILCLKKDAKDMRDLMKLVSTAIPGYNTGSKIHDETML